MEFELEVPKKIETVWQEYVPIIINGRTVDIYLTDEIKTPSTYNQLIHTLNTAYPGDTINLVINNGGGSVDSAFMIVDAITNSDAHVVAKLSGIVASAATMITMYCDDIEVAPFTQFMCHNYAYGASGSGNQVKEYVNFTDKELTSAVKIIYAGFLTEAEMAQISLDDKELWFGADETVERWGKKVLHTLSATEKK